MSSSDSQDAFFSNTTAIAEIANLSNDNETPQTTVPSTAPVNPSNPLKRQLSDNMEALIMQAKASKVTAGSSAGQTTHSLADTLEKQLTCAICCEVFKDPITVMDCLHNFCGSCYVGWARNNTTCPECRQHVRDYKDAFKVNPLIEMLHLARPDLKPSEEDMVASRDIYKPGSKTQRTSVTRNNDEYLSDDDEEEEEEEEEENQIWAPCPYCTPADDAPYTCNVPIQDGDRTSDWVRDFKSHKKCNCGKEVPFDLRSPALAPGFCAGCSMVSCGALFGGCANDPTNIGVLFSMRDTSLYQDQLQFSTWLNNNNSYEQDLLKRWIESEDNDYTWDKLGKDLREWLFQTNNVNLSFGTVVTVTPDSYLCKTCMHNLFTKTITDFLVSERERIGWTDIRSKCWYGKDCRTQRHNPDHCARLSHVWNPIPAEERREARLPPVNPPRASRVTHTGSVRGMGLTQSQPGTDDQTPVPDTQTAMPPPPASQSDGPSVPTSGAGASSSVAGDAGDPENSN